MQELVKEMIGHLVNKRGFQTVAFKIQTKSKACFSFER